MNWKAEQLLEKAIVAVRGRDYDLALAILAQALGESPQMAEAWTLRGNILLAQEKPFDALVHYDRAIDAKPGAADAWNNRGQALANLGRWDEAEEAFRRSVALVDTRDPHMGLANMFATLVRLDEAAAEYGRVVDADPSDHEAHFNLGVTLLGLGRWEDGFKAYHHRHMHQEFPPTARRDYPEWTGQPLAGKTILLYPEQGYGDEIMAARFAPWVAGETGARVVLEARAPFTRLAETCHVTSPYKVVTRGGAYPPDIDFSCSMMDVPMRLGLTPDMVSAPVYLAVPYKWPHKLPAGFNVGLCWSSGRHLSAAIGAMRMKSVPVHNLTGFVMPGVNLISLQKPAEPTPPEMCIHDWTDELHDLADTAALISALDLVITVDTAVAHLAGALGKPVWNLVRFSGYWPWLTPGDDPEHSIWYPSMRLLRQTALNDWSGPIATVERDLRALVAHREAAE